MSTIQSITINDTYPWGRNLEEYKSMFSLSRQDLGRRVLACADGPASFNAEMTRLGNSVMSIDPLYEFTAKEIRQRIDATYVELVAAARTNEHRFCWGPIPSPEALGQRRMAAMEVFLEDYEAGRAQGRYQAQSLPRVSFATAQFDLALCSHFLFLYSHRFDLNFHFQSVLEMLRVAREVRIFPLLDMDGWKSAHLEPLLARLDALGLNASVDRVDYEFQLGGNEMLRITQ
ncbi:MAG TPA: hypothetical protein VF669_16920 [Tepidisphaeraceae bacterium]